MIDDVTNRHRDMLDALAELGTDLARDIHAKAKAATAQATPPLAAAFDRVVRLVRRCIALYRVLGNPVQQRRVARQRIIRDVEDVIQRHTDGAEAESLHEELLDRMDRPDLDDDIAARPVAEIIKEMVRDLGLDIIPGAHPWARRFPDDIDALVAKACEPTPNRAKSVPPTPEPQAGTPAAGPPPDI